MKDNNLEYLINIIFKILGLYEKIGKQQIDEEEVTRENYMMYIEKSLIDLDGFIEIYKDNDKIFNILKKCKLSTVGILEFVRDDRDNHKLIRSKVLDMTNNISRFMEESDTNVEF